MTCYHNVVPSQFPMQIMMDGMQESNALTIYMAKAHILDNLLEDWLGSVSYMSTNMEIQFNSRSGRGGKRKGDHRISKLKSKRECGGGRGKGHERGHGGRGGHHFGSNSHKQANGWFHVVDCFDFRRRFSGKKITRLGAMGVCIYSTSARVTRIPATSRSFIKAGKIMGRS